MKLKDQLEESGKQGEDEKNEKVHPPPARVNDCLFTISTSCCFSFPETPAKKDMGTDLLIGVALGLLTTLTLFALLILAFVKIQSRRRSPPSQQQQQQQQQQQLHQQSDEPLAANSRTFLSASPSSSEDPDLIPLQMSKISKLTVYGPSTAAEPTTLSQEVMGLNPARFRTFFFLFYLSELQP